jgi:hypothetical protein
VLLRTLQPERESVLDAGFKKALNQLCLRERSCCDAKKLMFGLSRKLSGSSEETLTSCL